MQSQASCLWKSLSIRETEQETIQITVGTGERERGDVFASGVMCLRDCCTMKQTEEKGDQTRRSSLHVLQDLCPCVLQMHEYDGDVLPVPSSHGCGSFLRHVS